jgi:hypothetical protein
LYNTKTKTPVKTTNTVLFPLDITARAIKQKSMYYDIFLLCCWMFISSFPKTRTDVPGAATVALFHLLGISALRSERHLLIGQVRSIFVLAKDDDHMPKNVK